LKAIILAAGRGTRLNMDLPKALVRVDDQHTILDYQVEKLIRFIPASDILVVVGFKKELVMNSHPELSYVHNAFYASTNTSKSLLYGLYQVGNEEVLWLNGDVIFDPLLISRMLSQNSSCVLVDNKKCGPEEVKYRTDENGYLRFISKQLTEAEGEALGINLVSRDDLSQFRRHLEKVQDSDYFEKAIENFILQDGGLFKAIPSDGLFCHEVDFLEDLERVRAYLAGQKKVKL